MRAALMASALTVATGITGSTAGMLDEVRHNLGLLGGHTNKGPLIIHIERTPSLAAGGGSIHQTRCTLDWNGEHKKKCSSSALPR